SATPDLLGARRDTTRGKRPVPRQTRRRRRGPCPPPTSRDGCHGGAPAHRATPASAQAWVGSSCLRRSSASTPPSSFSHPDGHTVAPSAVGLGHADRATHAVRPDSAVPEGVLVQVLLVVVLGIVERTGLRDLGGDLAEPGLLR